MRYIRDLLINGDLTHLIEEDIFLDINSPGRATLTIISPELPEINSSVEFYLGRASADKIHLLFSGEVEKAWKLDNKHIKLFCRQFSARLYQTVPLNLRHCSMRDVLTEIANLTGLNFYLPKTNYSDKPVARYFNLGDGIAAMDRMAEVFQVPDFYWQQEGMKDIYVGSWSDSRWATRPIPVPLNLMKLTGSYIAKVPAIPSLLPGVDMTEHGRLLTLRHSKDHMELKWSPSK